MSSFKIPWAVRALRCRVTHVRHNSLHNSKQHLLIWFVSRYCSFETQSSRILYPNRTDGFFPFSRTGPMGFPERAQKESPTPSGEGNPQSGYVQSPKEEARLFLVGRRMCDSARTTRNLRASIIALAMVSVRRSSGMFFASDSIIARAVFLHVESSLLMFSGFACSRSKSVPSEMGDVVDM